MRSQLILDIHDEIIVDSFAGGGGASTGIELALSRSPDIALNHARDALAMHAMNHPQTQHVCEDVFKVDPVLLVGGRRVGLLWMSPDCTHFSKAKGGKPKSKKIRGLAWIGVKWAKHVRPRVIILENVQEFEDWGPLTKDNQPCPRRKGRTFKMFVSRLRGLGYNVEWRTIRGMTQGAPTIRERLFLIARCDGKPIVWPAQADWNPNAKRLGGPLKAYRTAAECIDWHIPCPSIFLTREEAKQLKKETGIKVKRPLVENTLRRIGKGVWKFVINAVRPFIVPLTHQGSDRVESVDEPMRTVTGAHRGERALIAAHITKFRTGSTGSGLHEPLHTVTAGPAENPAGAAHAMGLVAATLVQSGYGERPGQEPRAPGIQVPLGTVVAGGVKHAVVETQLAPFITEHANASNQRVMPADEPLRTQCSEVRGGHFAAVAATLTKFHGERRPGEEPRAVEPSEPLPTQTQENRFGVVSAFLAKHFTGVTGVPATEPMPTVTSKDHNALVSASLVGCGGRMGQSPPRSLDQPMQTITGKADCCLAAASLVREFGMSVGQPVDQPAPTIMPDGAGKTAVCLAKLYGTAAHGAEVTRPMPTVTATGNHIAEVRAFLVKYYGTAKHAPLTEPMHTVTGNDRFGLVMVEGEPYVIEDIGMRMLEPRELYRAQGFPEAFVIDRAWFDEGERRVLKFLPKDAQVRMVGNSVCPPVAAALVHANVPELAADGRRAVLRPRLPLPRPEAGPQLAEQLEMEVSS